MTLPIWAGIAILITVPLFMVLAVVGLLEVVVRMMYLLVGEKPPPLWSSKLRK